MPRLLLRRTTPVAALAFLLVAGCGRPEQVTGTVSLKGKPLSGVIVTLIPEGGGKGAKLVGAADAEGKFTALAPTGGKIIYGAYKVVVTDPAAPPPGAGGKKMADERAKDPFNAGQVPNQNPPLPPAVMAEGTTTVRVTIEAGKPVTIDVAG